METREDKPLAVITTIREKRKCNCCGKELPITSFRRRGPGYRKMCMACERVEAGTSDKFKDFTSRELMDELISRGFHGTLKFYRVEEHKL